MYFNWLLFKGHLCVYGVRVKPGFPFCVGSHTESALVGALEIRKKEKKKVQEEEKKEAL